MIATRSQGLYPCFRDRATRRDYWEDSPTSGCVGNRRWRPLTGSGYDIMHILACMFDSNEFSTVVLMLSGSGYKTRLLRKPLDVWKCKESKKPLNNCWLINKIVNSQLVQTSGGLSSSLACSRTLKT